MHLKAIPAGFALLLGVGLCHTANGQADSLSIGGPEDATTYEEVDLGVVDEAVESEAWTAADSAFHIPAYEVYRNWNTFQIFEQGPVITDTVHLQLAWADCDHHIPICGRVTSPFGTRWGRNHYGTDLKLQPGDPVACAFAGKVRISRYHRDFGHVVVVRHPNGLETLYGHMSKRLVEVGDDLEAGDLVGLGGSTGRSTGSHLHFETRYLGHPINPAELFDLEEGTLHADVFSILPKGPTAPIAATSSYYRVRKGDTLYSIARRSGTSVNRLCKMNRISTNGVLRVGQNLRVR